VRIHKKVGLLSLIGTLLLVGFLVTSLASYLVSRNLVRQTLIDQGLPLTGDTIYAELQRDLLGPATISSVMANDIFVREWLLSGEQDIDAITRYLAGIRSTYGAVASFLVSQEKAVYYYSGGVLKRLSPDDERDAWFYRPRDFSRAYEINVDIDPSNADAMTLFVDYKIFDFEGGFLGLTGIGFTLDSFSRVIDSAQQRFNRTIYFINTPGYVVASGSDEFSRSGSLRDHSDISGIVDRMLNATPRPVSLHYRNERGRVAVNSRYIPELRWYLVVEQEESAEVLPLKRLLLINLLIGAAIMLVVMGCTFFVLNRFRSRLEKAAATDPMTGLLNRQAFGIVFRQAVVEQSRRGGPMSVMLLDIDRFKQINDTFGHVTGDQVICHVADHLRRGLREMDVISRWGGDEFFILLKHCPAERAREIAEGLCRIIRTSPLQDDPKPCALTVSIGVAGYRTGESISDVFARADKGLYAAKASGRNGVVMVD